jgi:hypothetical protein
VILDFTHTKKIEKGSFITARIWIRSQTSSSDKKGPDPTESGSANLFVYQKLFVSKVFDFDCYPANSPDFKKTGNVWIPIGVATSPMKVVSWLGAVTRKNLRTLTQKRKPLFIYFA